MERLKGLLDRDNISQYRLAKVIGAPITTVNGWCKGKATPRDRYMNKLASFFNVHPAWLRYGDAQYAPTLASEAQMLAGEIAGYGPEAVQKTRQMLKIFFEGTVSEKRYPIQKKTKGRKTA